MNLLQKKSKSKCAVALGTALVIMAGVVLLPDFLGQDFTKTASGEAKTKKNVEKRLEEFAKKEGDEANREYGYPTKIYDYSEEKLEKLAKKENHETEDNPDSVNREYGYPTEIYVYQETEPEEVPLTVSKPKILVSKVEKCGYREAFDPKKDFDDVFEKITKYYQKKHQWEVFDYRFAENSHSLYPLYKDDYEVGNLIVFEVHTTDNPKGLLRSIALGRENKNAKWKVLNEGV